MVDEQAAGTKRKSTDTPGVAVKKVKGGGKAIGFAEEVKLNDVLARGSTDVPQSDKFANCAVCRSTGRCMESLRGDDRLNAALYCLVNDDSREVGVMRCQQCRVTVHTVCYGIRELVDPTTWCCCRCVEQPNQSVICELCPNLGGAFVRLETPKKWVHVSCAIWVPETRFSNWEDPDYKSSAPFMTPPVVGLDAIDKARFKLKCKVCRQKTEQGQVIPKRPKGACIQCANGNCHVAAHVTCAQESLVVCTDWSLFPSHRSMSMYCQDRHIPPWLKLDLQKRREQALGEIREGDRVWARCASSAKKWYKGEIQAIDQVQYCWVRVSDGQEYKVQCDQITLAPDEIGDDIEMGKRVFLSWDDADDEPGEVGAMEEDVFYTVQFNDGDIESGLRRSDLVRESEWATRRPPGAEEGSHDDEGDEDDEVEDYDMSEIDLRFIVERSQRRAAAIALQETSKLLSDEPAAPVKTEAVKASFITKPNVVSPTPAIVTPPVIKVNSGEVIETVREQFRKWVRERKSQKQQRSKIIAS